MNSIEELGMEYDRVFSEMQADAQTDKNVRSIFESYQRGDVRSAGMAGSLLSGLLRWKQLALKIKQTELTLLLKKNKE